MAGNKCAEHGYTHEECECSVWALPWKVSPPALVTHDELPAWAQDNEYIVAHYRPVFQDWRKCVHSWFYLHNQSGNIYSHMIAFVCFVGLYINTWTGIYRETGCMSDVLSLLPAALGGLGVLFFSTLFHTMRCASMYVCTHICIYGHTHIYIYIYRYMLCMYVCKD
jgi:adiponectin receptor